MEQKYQKNGLVNWIALLSIGFCAALLARYAGSSSGLIAAIYLGLGFLVAVVSYIQMRLAEREYLERFEFEELKRTKGDSTLFADAASDTFPAKRSREQFDRFFVPAFTLGLLILESYFAFWGWEKFSMAEPPIAARATFSMALFGLSGLVLFLLGKYAAGIARIDKQLLLRPGASYMMMGSVICFLVAVAEGGTFFEFQNLDIYLAKALCVLLVIVAVENLLTLIFELYRPKVANKAARTLYESRLIGLLGQPQGIITTVAQALDYQFGFKVSETWFYRFLEKALAWIVLIQIGVLLLSSMVVIIEPGEQAILERFGRPVTNSVKGPGLHLKLPWPLDKIYRHSTEEIQKFNVGFTPHEEVDGVPESKVLLWTRSHYQEEENLLVASREQVSLGDGEAGNQAVPVNLLTVSVPIHFVIDDVNAWVYNHRSPAAFLEKIAFSEVVRYLVSVDIMDIMSVGRIGAAKELLKRINKKADDYELGVEIIFVGLQDIHPPVKVADAFEGVIIAEQKKEAKIYEARGYALALTAIAGAEAVQIVHQAKAEAVAKVSDASSFASALRNRMEAFKASPSTYKERTLYRAIAIAASQSRKYVIGTTNTRDVIVMNLEDKLRDDLLDISVPGKK